MIAPSDLKRRLCLRVGVGWGAEESQEPQEHRQWWFWRGSQRALEDMKQRRPGSYNRALAGGKISRKGNGFIECSSSKVLASLAEISHTLKWP